MLQPKQDTPADKAAGTAAAELYDRDTVLWSDQQAELLTRLSKGGSPAGIDWENIIEEIESVGRSQVNAVQSLLLQAIVHELKIVLWPDTPYVEGWRNESLLFQAQAAQQFAPSMYQKIDVTILLVRALRAVPSTIDGVKHDQESLMIAAFNKARDQVDQWITDPNGHLRTIDLTRAEPDLFDLLKRNNP